MQFARSLGPAERGRERESKGREAHSTNALADADARLVIRGLYLENGNRDQNLVYKIQWGSGVLPRYTSGILGLCYAIQVIMERRRNGGGKGEKGGGGGGGGGEGGGV